MQAMKQKTVKSIVSMVLAAVMCFSLLPMPVSAADSDFVIKDGVLEKYNGKGTDVVIPDGVTSIGRKAFASNKNLTSVTIPDSVTSIDNEAFVHCANLTSIALSKNLTSIGRKAFGSNKNLTSVTIPDSVTSIDNEAFIYCANLTSIALSKNLTSIGNKAFNGCEMLTNVTIPNGVKIISEQAFGWCDGLTSIALPDSVTSIEDGAFTSCENLKSVTMQNGVTSIGKRAFNDCDSLTSITIPNSVKSIGDMAFNGCRNLVDITLPDSVTIGTGAFGSILAPVFHGKYGSDAEEYAKTYKFKFVATGGTSITPITAEKPSAWAEAHVNTAIAAGIVPQALQAQYTQATTRAEFCALAVALYEKVKGTEIAERQTFNDTTDVNIQKAAAIGVVSGVGNNNFAPNDKLTREQAATMLSRLAAAIGKPLTEQAATFADNGKVSTWAAAAVGQVQASGSIMGGVGNNTFAPQGDYTREQSIITALRLYNVVNGGSAQTTTPTSSYSDYGFAKNVKIPDFGEVVGATRIGESVEAFKSTYVYIIRYNLPEAGWAKKYDEAIRQAGFERGEFSGAKTDEKLIELESGSSPKLRANWGAPNNIWVGFKSRKENGAGVPYIEVRADIPIEYAASTKVYSTIQTFTQEKGYAAYDICPEVPDFGAIFKVELEDYDNTLGLPTFYYTLEYEKATGHAAAFLNELNAQEAYAELSDKYIDVLKECGFVKKTQQSVGGDYLDYWQGFGFSVLVSYISYKEYKEYKDINKDSVLNVTIQKLK